MNARRLTLNRLWISSLLLLLVFSNLLSLQAQTIKWKDSPEKTYVFEISNKEVEKLLKSQPQDSLVLKMLHTPVTSFSGVWDNRPEKGHFILARINRNKVDYWYHPIIPFQVFLFKEYGILTLQVTDDEGNIRNDAKVKIHGRWRLFDTRVDFDKESQTYTIDDWSEKENRILTVELDKFKAVFDLEKHLVHPWYSSGYNRSGNSPDFYSYMITDKNKYKPGESVRFKSYALSGSKSPIKKELEVWISDENYKFKKIAEVTPYHPGGFAGEVQLHDSLKLKLDKSYTLQLRNQKGRIVANTHFRYEDYELYDSKLEVKLKNHTQYYPDTNQVEIKVTDANGLLLHDVKADVLIKRRNVNNIYTDILIMPDTLMYKRIDLDNTAPTKVDIPPSLFEKTDCTYEIQVLVLTFDNQRLLYNNLASFFRSHLNVEYTTRNDTIRFEFKELGKDKNVKARLSYGDSKDSKLIELPYEEPFKQSVQSYNIEIADPVYKKNFYTSAMHSELDLTGGIMTDSFNVALVNPLNLEVSWYIYQGNVLLQKGSGNEFDFKYPNTDLEFAHYVEIFYFMGNEEKVFRRVFIPKKEYLSIDVDLPSRIYPGQKLDATITVTDNLGKPVKDVDLTAFSVNTLLNHYIPDLPYYGAPPQTREQRSSYSIKDKNFSFSMPLDYKFWNKLAALDQMDYYRFTYPWKTLFKYAVDTPDSSTQFAPYVMKDGNAVNIYTIERNGVPVYFSWTEQPQGYSFQGTSQTKQEISLRLHDRLIILDSMRLEEGKKTIFSVDLDHLPPNTRVVKINQKDKYGRNIFTDHEKSRYVYYISQIPVNGNDFVYLKQGKNVYPVFHTCMMKNRDNVTIGPLLQLKTQYMDGVEYYHEGGFSYQFKENVVYKYPYKAYPDFLTFSTYNDFSRLNEFSLTDTIFKKIIEDCKTGVNRWHPKSIYISQNSMNMNFRLPVEKDSTGVSNLLFRNRKTNKILFPDKYENGVRKYSSISHDIYDIILLYNNGKYLMYEDIPLNINTYTDVNMAKLPIHEADSLSKKWLALRGYAGEIGTPKPIYNQTSFYTRPVLRQKAGNTVSGYIYDNTGEPLIGVSIMLKGTKYGSISDIDGYFEIDVDNPLNILSFRYIGFVSKEVSVTPGSEISVTLEEDMQALDEVVVVAYGISRSRKSLTMAAQTISHSNEASAPQSPPEKLEDTGDDKAETEDAEDNLYSELMMLNGLRTNFSDVGFWEPRLYTDRKGKASFSITFPDNITKWDAVIYAMNRKLKTGTLRKSIKSYKLLMAELRTPQFLVVGDSSYFAGNIRNYTKDNEIEGKLLFAIGEDSISNKDITFTTSHQDYTLVTATDTDSISATYLFTRNDGYSDGEKRSIAIQKQGTEIAEGTLSFLRNGEKLDVVANKNEEINIGITMKQLDVYMDATYYLTGYKYACNEQLASKLIGLLNYRSYQQFMGKKFENDKNVNEIMKRLIDNRNDKKLWSWWGRSSDSSYWMSAHIMRALRMAKEAGYNVNLDLRVVESDYIDTKSFRNTTLYDIDVLHALSEWGTEQNYAAAVEFFEDEIKRIEIRDDSIAKENKYHYRNSFLKEKLLLWEIRQKQNIGYSSDSISRYLKKDVLGSVYCDDKLQRPWYSDNLSTTLIAYRIVRKDSTLMHLKEPMQMYILGTKQYGWNTYQASSAVSTILPDLFAESYTKDKPATIVLTGKENKEVIKFPYETKLQPGEHLSIEKKDGLPLIYTAYSIKRVTDANIGEAFEVSTMLNSGDSLIAGKPATLTVEVKVKQKNAEYVLIEVPIPAGCSYASKHNYWYGREVHREYFKEKTVIFCRALPEGTYKFDIQLLPRYTGRYTLNPAKAEMMYFPVINANNDMRKIEIEDRK